MEGVLKPDEIKNLVSVLAPGLIIFQLRYRVLEGARPELKDQILQYAAASAIYYAIFYPLFNWPDGFKVPYAVWYILQYFLIPSFIGIFAAYSAQYNWEYKLGALIGLTFAHPIPAAWDFTFSKLKSGTFVLVTLEGGEQVAGLLGHRSFASSSKDERDLLIEQVWEAKEGEWVESDPARSILLCGRDIRHVEIFED
jgi:hypothetical protein